MSGLVNTRAVEVRRVFADNAVPQTTPPSVQSLGWRHITKHFIVNKWRHIKWETPRPTVARGKVIMHRPWATLHAPHHGAVKHRSIIARHLSVGRSPSKSRLLFSFSPESCSQEETLREDLTVSPCPPDHQDVGVRRQLAMDEAGVPAHPPGLRRDAVRLRDQRLGNHHQLL